MPGNCPAGAWVKRRAHRIMSEGDVPKHIAYALATQQGHKVGKTPKDFKTEKGVREAKQKYDAPKSTYQKTAMLAAFFDELDQMEKDGMGWFGRKVVAPLAIAGGLAGGGAKLISHMGTKAPTAITQTVGRGVANMGAGGMMGGRTIAGQEALRLAGM
jgi:hypothetical protein